MATLAAIAAPSWSWWRLAAVVFQAALDADVTRTVGEWEPARPDRNPVGGRPRGAR